MSSSSLKYDSSSGTDRLISDCAIIPSEINNTPVRLSSRTCGNCFIKDVKFLYCSACNNIAYCSQDCQK